MTTMNDLSLLLRPALAIGLSAALLSPVQARAQGDDVTTYTMKSGDTLATLAARYFIRSQDYAAVQRLNMVTDPHRMSIGKVLRIPSRLLKSKPIDASLVAYRGTISVTSNNRALTPVVGMGVTEGMQLATGADGFLTFALSNGSRITLPSRSRVSVRSLRQFLLGNATDVDIMVDQGRAETNVTPLPNPASRYRLRTPTAVSAVRGTTFRVGYVAGSADSLTEVVEGKVDVGIGGKPASLIQAGSGAIVGKDGGVAIEQLLPAIALLSPGKVQKDVDVSLTLDAAESARQYHTQLSSDAGFVDLVAEAYTTTPQVGFSGIGDGTYFVRAAAVSANGLEGLTQTYSMKRRLSTLGGAIEKSDDGRFAFKWFGDGKGERLYRFQIATAADFAAPLVDETGLQGKDIAISQLSPGDYFWRIRVLQFGDGEIGENWTAPEKLIVSKPE